MRLVHSAADIRWGDPPPVEEDAPPVSKWEAIAAVLQERPGQWAVVATSPSGSGGAKTIRSNILRGRARGIEAGHYECRVKRGNPLARPTEYDEVYARYVGPQPEATS